MHVMANLNEKDKGSDSVRRSGRPRKPKVHWSPDIDAVHKRERLNGQKDVCGNAFEKEDSTSSSKSDAEGDASNNAVKVILAEEIQKQVLNRLGTEAKTTFQDLQVAEIQDVWRKHKEGEVQDDEQTLQHILKVKLVATLYVPLVFQKSQSRELKENNSQVEMQTDEQTLGAEDCNLLEREYTQKTSEYKHSKSQQEEQVQLFEENTENMPKIDVQEEQVEPFQENAEANEDNKIGHEEVEVKEKDDFQPLQDGEQEAPRPDKRRFLIPNNILVEQNNAFQDIKFKQEERIEDYMPNNYEEVEPDKNILIVDIEVDQEEMEMKDVGILDVGETLLDVGEFDLYNFDSDRTEDKILEGQVWALYDEKDGMPRLYALIIRVLSTCPFKAQIAWLESNAETLGTLTQQTSGCRLTCGEFCLEKGQYTLVTYIDCFSHVVKASIHTTGDILVMPAEGDVWALYSSKMISSGSLSQTRYEIVQIVSKDSGALVTVVPLVKVDGFRTRFTRKGKPFIVSTKQVDQFSHRIPSILLHGEHASLCPEPCLELDPASTPEF